MALRSGLPRRLALLAAASFGALAAAGKKDAGKAAGGGWREKTDSEGRVVQELKIEAPSFTEEDQFGYVMPERYKCDSCRAVMYHLDQELQKVQPKSRRLKQWEYTDVFDATCRGAFEGYGIKLIHGENTLSGPGLKHDESLAPGSGAIQMGGESWSKRLGEICRKIVFEKVGEEELYERFYEKYQAEANGEEAPEQSGLGEWLCTSELKDCIAGPRPPPKPKAKESKEQPVKAKSEKPKAKQEKTSKAKAKAESGAQVSASRRKDEAREESKTEVSSEERVDVQTFLRSLAVKHGLTSDEYLAARTLGEWERLTVAMAGRIFNRMSEGDTCRAAA